MDALKKINVPLDKAMLLYVPGTDKALMVEIGTPTGNFRWKGYSENSTGACFAHYRNREPIDQLATLIVNGMQAIIRDGVDPMSIHEALCQVKDYRDSLAADVPGSGNK